MAYERLSKEGGCLTASEISNDKTSSLMMRSNSTSLNSRTRFYDQYGNEVTENYGYDDEYYPTSMPYTEIVSSPYNWHEACVCSETFEEWFPEHFGSSYFCKLACDIDPYCKGYFKVGSVRCAIVTTNPCPAGCSKYFEGNRGQIARNVPFSKLVGGRKFGHDTLGGCFHKRTLWISS